MTTELTTVNYENELAAIEATAKRFAVADQIAAHMSAASILPEHLRTDRNRKPLPAEQVRANCVLIVNQALRWGVDPFAIMPSTYVVGGKLGFDGKLIAAVVNKQAGLIGPLTYTFAGQGDGLTVTVAGTIRGEAEPRTVELSVKHAKTDNKTWKTDPEQMLCYAGARRWARRHVPEVLLGMQTRDEIAGEVIDVEPVGNPIIAELHKQTMASGGSGNFVTVEEIPVEGVDVVDMIGDYKNRIEAVEDRESAARLADRIESELVLPDPARQDLMSKLRERYAGLPV